MVRNIQMSSGLLRGVRFLKPTFRDYLPLLSSSIKLSNKKVVPKRRFQTTLRRKITQKTEEFSSTAAEAYDIAIWNFFINYFVGSKSNDTLLGSQ